ncbi:TauD/TfdA dioxygenase family protein [Sandarakinorhabdus sp. DWP1-3-1]|uniref:TauD/TfdA dioxygenase family protein n=1 Tax=Sandarakinorhabdus sp. DWP1-3-1 TaxID=2804627 RepID=UPI003CEE7957
MIVSAQPSGFGATVTGVDLSRPLPPEDLAAIRAAWAAHAVLSFPGQPLTLDAQEALTLQFGDFGEDPFIKPLPGRPHILELRREADETAPNFGAGWHSDWSFQPQPPAATILHGKVIPPIGGDTLFADCAAAYDSLSPAFQRLCDSLTALHSARLPYGRDGVYANETASRTMTIITGEAAEAVQAHPLVRVHPATGRRALYCSPVYTIGIEGMTRDEGYAILGHLFQRIIEPQFLFRHRWAPDTLLIWDNRCTLHFAEGGYDGHLRVMHRTTVAGEAVAGVA